MPHVLKTIQDRIESRLTGLPTTGAAVYTDRVHAIPEGKLPALVIQFAGEQRQLSATRNGGPPPLDHRATFAVRMLAKGEPLDDRLYAIAAEVEAALFSDFTLGGLVKACSPTDLQAVLSPDGAIREGEAVLLVRVDYRTIQGARR